MFQKFKDKKIFAVRVFRNFLSFHCVILRMFSYMIQLAYRYDKSVVQGISFVWEIAHDLFDTLQTHQRLFNVETTLIPNVDKVLKLG